MPEGDTIFRTARTLGRALVGKPVTAFRSTYPAADALQRRHAARGPDRRRVEARGKWLLIHFSGGGILASHLLMNGRWHIYRHGERWQLPRIHMRIVIENSEYQRGGISRARGARCTRRSRWRAIRAIPRPENDVLRAEFDAAAALERLLARGDEAIADALLDQAVLAGVGNVFKSEICFVNGLHPFRTVATLTREEAAAAIAARAKAAEGQRARGLRRHDRDLSRAAAAHHARSPIPSASLWVYGRAGEPCRRCGEPIRSRIQGADARVTFWCPRCQPMPDGSDVDGT